MSQKHLHIKIVQRYNKLRRKAWIKRCKRIVAAKTGIAYYCVEIEKWNRNKRRCEDCKNIECNKIKCLP